MKKIMLAGALLAVLPLCSEEGAPIPFAEDRIMAAILASDPVAASHFLMPGFFVRADQKKEYLFKAQEMTNQTYMELNEFGLSDIARLLIGLTKCALGASALWYAAPKLSSWYSAKEGGDAPPTVGGAAAAVAPALPAEPKVDKFSLEGLKGVRTKIGSALCGAYVALRGLKDLKTLGTRSQRYINHHNALAVEAIIQRLPVCQNGIPPEIIKT